MIIVSTRVESAVCADNCFAVVQTNAEKVGVFDTVVGHFGDSGSYKDLIRR